MNWSKAKNILIIFFLCTDLFLLSIMLLSTQRTSVVTDDIIDYTITILNNNRIYIDPNIIPRRTNRLPMAEAYNIISDYESFAKLLAGDDAAMTGTDLYSGSNGTVSYVGDKFDFTTKGELFSDITAGLNQSNAPQIALDILKNYNFDDNGLLFDTTENNGRYTVTVTKEDDGLYYFNCALELVMTSDGLEKISGSWFYETGTRGERIDLKSVAGVLIDYISLANRPAEEEYIAALDLGYSVLEEDIYHRQAMFTPCWRITLDNGSEYVLNAAETPAQN